MDLYINVFIIICGFIGTVVAIGGKTCLETDAPLLRRITVRGWIGLACLVASFTVGIVKESRSAASSDKSARQSFALSNELATAHARIDESREYLRYVIYATPVPGEFSDEILQRVNSVIASTNLPSPDSTVAENGSIAFEFSDSGKRIGFLVLSKMDMGDLALLPNTERDEMLKKLIFGPWGKDDLGADSATIHKRIYSIVEKILYPKFRAAGISSETSKDKTALIFYPVNGKGKQISREKLTLDLPTLTALMKLSPLKRGAQIADISERLH